MNVPVSIVIPVYNGRKLLEQLLDSISRQTATPLEVIVVDNGSSDGAPESARRAGARVIELRRNLGFAPAVNRGIREARGEGIAIVNSDVELDNVWLERLWRGVSENALSFATGKILQRESPDILDGSYDLICRAACSWRAGAGQLASALPETLHPIRFCSATAAIFRTDIFQTVGLFEETFESYLEDVDFGLRCALAGRTGAYLPDAVCWHRGSATFGRWHAHVVRLIARNQVLLIARYYSTDLIRRWLWPIVVGHLLWGGLAVRHRCGTAWLRGKMQGLRRFPAIRRLAAQNHSRLESIVIQSEREIHELQSKNGFDAYWKLYFRLTGSPKCLR